MSALVRFCEKAQLLQLNSINHEQVEGADEELLDLLLRRVGTRDINAESFGLKTAAVAEKDGGVEFGTELVWWRDHHFL
jgi:hypothetical protein